MWKNRDELNTLKENFSIIDTDKIFVHHLSSVQFLGSVNQVQANKSAPSLVPGINKLSQHSQPLSQHSQPISQNFPDDYSLSKRK